MSTAAGSIPRSPDEKVDWVRSIPFLFIHALGLGGLVYFAINASSAAVFWKSLLLCVALYYVRMFFLTATFHRYLSHRSYKMGRVMQFLMTFGATTTAQKGPLWWASNHRHHHRYSDQVEDVHSPKKGFWWSHVGWILAPKWEETDLERIKDFAQFRELRWLNKYHLVPPALLGLGVWLAGDWLVGDKWAALFVGFFFSTVVLWHGTFTINSLSHVFGKRRFVTTDTSRNSFLLALITCGEGWHNNHHYYQSSTRQGFYWWEIDFTFYILKVLSWVGLVKDLRSPTEAVLGRNRVEDGHYDVGLLGEQPADKASGGNRKQPLLEPVQPVGMASAD